MQEVSFKKGLFLQEALRFDVWVRLMETKTYILSLSAKAAILDEYQNPAKLSSILKTYSHMIEHPTFPAFLE